VTPTATLHLRGGDLEPALSWSAVIQPVPLHRSRIVFAQRKTWAYNEDVDKVFRDELRQLWNLAGFGRRSFTPLEGDLIVHMTFAGRTQGRRHQRPDVSNLLKAVEDAGNPHPRGGWRGLWGDDRQIRVLAGQIAAWGSDVTPRIDLDVWRYGE
jgi:Holliday junction resolvase RusA-like endonuclease